MSFVKLDCGLLDSTLWIDRVARELFITALLMAEPIELQQNVPQLNTRDLELTGFIVPSGWYGFVGAAGSGIIRRAGMGMEEGLMGLETLASEDNESRSPEFGGRRLVRINGGYLILNFIKYREKDSTSAERSRRWRERQKLKELNQTTRVSNTPQRVIRHQAEVEVEVEAEEKNTKNNISNEVISHLNLKTGRNFRSIGSNNDLINARVKEGYSLDDLKKVIDLQTSKWINDPKMRDFLRPSTLFGKEKFSQYVGFTDEKEVKQTKDWGWASESTI